MFRLLAPAGSPIAATDIARALALRLQPGSGTDTATRLIAERTSAGHCFLLDSGRTALMVSLKALSKLAGPVRDEVIMPAYTCYTVAAAVARCGLKIRLADIDPSTMDYCHERLESANFGRVLAIVGNDLFGIMSDWRRLRCLARQRGIYLVDDAAQSMGASHREKPSGCLGDIGFFSLGRGKNLTAYTGGVLLTDEDGIAGEVRREIMQLPQAGILSEMALIAKVAAVSLLLRPRLFWLPARMPLLKLGETVFDPEFDAARMTNFQTALLGTVYRHLDRLNDARRENARMLAEKIAPLNRYDIPGYERTDCPAYLRLPVLARDRENRDRLVTALKAAGISASTMYPSTIRRIPGIEKHLASACDSFNGAQQVVDRLLTLPTHAYVSDSDIDRMVSILAGTS
ncbi:MAG: DegT/DnrJ/EryC1/StrS family aminotransferase [Candidatus Zixiibacteriota bacterium]|nr:MAG: DegT/DnrJ/EryC1/StrS family aminotransferase [candidate division Zixibacteria bacterium]